MSTKTTKFLSVGDLVKIWGKDSPMRVIDADEGYNGEQGLQICADLPGYQIPYAATLGRNGKVTFDPYGF